jgi:hypothetical protein
MFAAAWTIFYTEIFESKEEDRWRIISYRTARKLYYA